MIETFKSRFWDMLKEKDVSLALLFNHRGEILWSRGRAIMGKDVFEGEGFPKTYVHQILKSSDPIEQENIIADITGEGLSESAIYLRIKSLLILPLHDSYYLYLDSGIKEYFSDSDKEIFTVLGDLLGEMISAIKERESEAGGISGTSRQIENIRELVLNYAIEDAPVLLLGETGVGKSHIAELIYRYSGRRGKFITVNTPGIPKDLFESEVFGHKKGSFTDAKTDKPGYVDEADGGILFFDEISEVPVSFQAKLLRFIETKCYSPLGEPREKKADVRIIAATNRDLMQLIKQNQFREDLYYRLNVLPVRIPPLRERREDIRTLVMEKRDCLKGKDIGRGFWTAVMEYSWPGNIRELFTVLTRVGIHGGDPITGEDFRAMRSNSAGAGETFAGAFRYQAEEGFRQGKNFWEVVWKSFIDRDIHRGNVREVLHDAYQKSQGSFTRMIRYLNLKDEEYHNFMALMHKYGIDPRK